MQRPAPIAAAMTAKITWQQAVERASDALQKAERPQSARAAHVVAIGPYRHVAATRSVGHGDIVSPAVSGGANDALAGSATGVALGRSQRGTGEQASSNDDAAEPHGSPS